MQSTNRELEMAPLVVPAVVGYLGYHEGRGILREFWISRGIFSFGRHEGNHARGLIFGILTNFLYNFQTTYIFLCAFVTFSLISGDCVCKVFIRLRLYVS